jgi:hypothetical protein
MSRCTAFYKIIIKFKFKFKKKNKTKKQKTKKEEENFPKAPILVIVLTTELPKYQLVYARAFSLLTRYKI